MRDANATESRESPVRTGNGLAIRAENVTKIYGAGTEDAVHALEDVELEVEEGSFVTLLGPSGCGKSTMLHLVAGLLAPTTGDVELLGKKVRGPQTDLGLVFQQDLLLPWRDVLDNVLLQVEMRKLKKSDYKSRALDLLDNVGLGGFENKRPRELSGGMRQRVAICRALIHDPPILLMDEPFGALDAMTRDQMALDLSSIAQAARKSVLFVTHSISEAVFLSDVIIIMSPRPGRIREVIEVDLPRPRRLALREDAAFTEYTARIRETFESMGILRDRTLGASKDGTDEA